MSIKKDSIAKFLLDGTDTVKELVTMYLITIVLASLSFCYFEAMAFKDAMWMSFVAATSTGFGDFYPKTAGGRVTCVLLMHSTLFLIVPLMVARLLSVAVKDRNAFTHEEQEEILTYIRRIRGEEAQTAVDNKAVEA